MLRLRSRLSVLRGMAERLPLRLSAGIVSTDFSGGMRLPSAGRTAPSDDVDASLSCIGSDIAASASPVWLGAAAAKTGDSTGWLAAGTSTGAAAVGAGAVGVSASVGGACASCLDGTFRVSSSTVAGVD